MQNSFIDFILSVDSGIHEKIKQNKEYEKLSEEGFKIYDKLKDTLNGEQIMQLNKLSDTHMGLQCESSDKYFKAGVKFGVRFIIECLSD